MHCWLGAGVDHTSFVAASTTAAVYKSHSLLVVAVLTSSSPIVLQLQRLFQRQSAAQFPFLALRGYNPFQAVLERALHTNRLPRCYLLPIITAAPLLAVYRPLVLLPSVRSNNSITRGALPIDIQQQTWRK